MKILTKINKKERKLSNFLKITVIGYKLLSRKDIEGNTAEKGLSYLLKQIRKGILFCFLKELNKGKLNHILTKLHILEKVIRVNMHILDMQILYCIMCLKVTRYIVLWHKTDRKVGINFY